MDLLKKIGTILLVILFPLGILYCIGKNLFTGNFASFLGGVFLFAVGFVVSIVLFRPDIVEPVIQFITGLFSNLAAN